MDVESLFKWFAWGSYTGFRISTSSVFCFVFFCFFFWEAFVCSGSHVLLLIMNNSHFSSLFCWVCFKGNIYEIFFYWLIPFFLPFLFLGGVVLSFMTVVVMGLVTHILFEERSVHKWFYLEICQWNLKCCEHC